MEGTQGAQLGARVGAQEGAQVGAQIGAHNRCTITCKVHIIGAQVGGCI